MIDKREFIDRLLLASRLAAELAGSLEYVDEQLPLSFWISIFVPEKLDTACNENEEIKFLGGRLIRRKDLKGLDPIKAGKLLWVNGKVPSWINVRAVGCTADYTEIEIMYSRGLVQADPECLWPDLNMKKGNPLVPFRVRGPSVAEWSVRTSA